MIYKFIFFLLITTTLFSKERVLYDKLTAQVEAGIFMSDFSGAHSTVSNDTTTFKDDFGYKKAASSYFAGDVNFGYSYIPNIGLKYINATQSNNVELTKDVTIVGFDFTGLITSQIVYDTMDVILSYEMKKKGKIVPFLWTRIYTGDMSYSVGVDIKYSSWNFQLIQREDPTATFKFVNVDFLMPMPYLAFKYYYYNSRIYGNISALSLGDANALSYEIGYDFQIIKNIFLSASYLYESFEAIEKQDTVNFITSGNKFSFKYRF